MRVLFIAVCACGCGIVIDPISDLTSGKKDAGAEGAIEASACVADLQTDDKNCGRCGHDCRGSACMKGLCAPIRVSSTPIDTFDVQGGVVFTGAMDGTTRIDMGTPTKLRGEPATNIKATATNVFFSNGAGVFRMTPDGGNLTQLASGATFGRVKSATHVYWTRGSDLWRAAADGSSSAELWGTFGNEPRSISADPAWVAVAVNPTQVMYQREAATGATVLASSPMGYVGNQSAVSSLGVYFTTYAGAGQRLNRADRGTPKSTFLFAPDHEIIGMASDPSLIVFGFNGVLPLRACFDAACAGGMQLVTTGDFSYVDTIVLDADFIYWSDGGVWKVGR